MKIKKCKLNRNPQWSLIILLGVAVVIILVAAITTMISSIENKQNNIDTWKSQLAYSIILLLLFMVMSVIFLTFFLKKDHSHGLLVISQNIGYSSTNPDIIDV